MVVGQVVDAGLYRTAVQNGDTYRTLRKIAFADAYAE